MTALIVDGIRRKKVTIFFLTLQIVFMCRAGWSDSGWLDEIAVPLVVSAFLNMTAQQWFVAREFSLLPVSRRTVWLAQWWLSVPLASLLMVSAVHFAFWSTRPSEWSWGGTVMTLIYCLAYTGNVQAGQTTSFARRGDEPATLRNVGGWMLLVFGLIAAPAAFGPYLPHRPDDVGPVTVGLLVISLILAIRGYRYTPPIVARQNLRATRIPQPPSAQPYVAPQDLSAEERATRKERLRSLPLWNGFRLLVWLEGRRDFIATVVTLGFLVFVWMLGFFDEKGLYPWHRFAGSVGFLPFLHAPGTLADMMAIGAFGFFASMGSHGRIDHVRLLRTLPLSTHRLIARVAVLGAVSGLVVWLVLLLLHLVSTFSLPVSLRVDVLVAATAMMMLLSAVRLAMLGTHVPPPIPQAIGVLLPCTLWYAAFQWPIGSPALSMILANLLVFATGYAVLIAAITRSSRIYRQPTPVVRLG